jgi:deoxyhypusine synthase
MDRKEHLHTPVTPFPISPRLSVSELVERMAGTSFQARNLARGAQIWEEMLKGETTIFLGLAGAMIPAGMRPLMVYLIQNRLIDCLVSTGANLFHDLHETLGHPHLRGQPQADDHELFRRRINRIYDVLLPEDQLEGSEEFIIDFSCSLNQDRAYTTREYLYLLGKELSSMAKTEGMLTAAVRAGVPIYCPALGDSVFGTALAAARVQRENHLLMDIAQDVVEMVELTTTPPATGVIFIGGGTPKNYIQQAVLCGDLFGRELRGHNYAIQVTMDSPQWGGLSGCTFEECHSWGKEALDAQMVTIYSDATIALPILVSALAESCADTMAQRKKARLAQVNTKP